MKTAFSAVAGLAVLVAGIGTAHSEQRTYYCAQRLLQDYNGTLSCTWSPTFTGACMPMPGSYFEKAAVISGPTEAGKCHDGTVVISITVR
jgi:hypothetical protein